MGSSSDHEFHNDFYLCEAHAFCDDTQGGGPRNEQATAQSDGTSTTYELSKPLKSGDSRDFSLSFGQTVGFDLLFDLFDSTRTVYAQTNVPAQGLGLFDFDRFGDIVIATPPPPPPPIVSNTTATAVDRREATLQATVTSPDGEASVRFQYGEDQSYGSETPPQTVAANGQGVPVTAQVSGLRPATTYHFRAAATNAGGTTLGADQILQTGADLAPVVRAIPARAKLGSRVRLRFTVEDDTGEARSEIRVLRGTTQAAVIELPFAVAPVTRVAYWKAPRRGSGYRFCARAVDRAGNTSVTSCAPIMLR